jgi:hypothetical protein
MARGKSNKLKPFEKLLTVMVSGKPVTIDEIETTLGKEIHMYRISTYIWHIKTFANGVVKSIKDGRKISAYQVMNVDTIKEYFKITGIDPSKFVPGQTDKIIRAKKIVKTAASVQVNNLSDLKAEPQEKDISKDEEIEVTEITE